MHRAAPWVRLPAVAMVVPGRQDDRSTQPCVHGARPKRVRYPAGLIVAPILLLAAAATGCAAPTTAKTSGTTPASTSTACPGQAFAGSGQPSSAFPVSPATGVIASAPRSVAAPPVSLTTPTQPISASCPPEASIVGSPTPAVTSVQTSPPPPSASPGTASLTPTAPSVAPKATISAGHTLTFADNGAVIALTVGQHLDLVLAPDGLGAWDRPIIDGTGLAITAVSGGYPSSIPLRVTFTAQSTGDATIRTFTDLACFHTTPKCLPPVMLWSVTVHATNAAQTSAFALCQSHFATVLAADMWTVRAARGPFGPRPTTPLPDPFAGYSPDQAVALCLRPGDAGGLKRVVALVSADGKAVPMWSQNGDAITVPG